MSNWGAHGEPDSVDAWMRRFGDWIDAPLPAPPREKVTDMRERIKQRAKLASPESNRAVHPQQRVARQTFKADRSRYYTPSNLIEEMISHLILCIPVSDWREVHISDPSVGPRFVCNVVVHAGDLDQGTDLHIRGERWDVQLKQPHNLAPNRELQLYASRHVKSPTDTPADIHKVTSTLLLYASAVEISDDSRTPTVIHDLPDSGHLSRLAAIAVLPISAWVEPIALLYDGPTKSTADEINDRVRDFVREVLLQHYADTAD